MGFVNKFFSVANPMVIDLKSVVNQIAGWIGNNKRPFLTSPSHIRINMDFLNIPLSLWFPKGAG